MTTEKTNSFKDLCESYGVDYSMVPEIISFEVACKERNVEPSKLPDVSMLPERHQKSIIANYKLWIIVEALNQGWVPDWKNHYEYKYTAWFYMEEDEESSSGVGFSYYGFGYWYTATDVGSRLCFKNRELAKFAGKHFLELFRTAFLIE